MCNLAMLLVIVVVVVAVGSVSAYYTVNSDLNSFRTVDNIIDQTVDNKVQKTSLGDLVKTLIDTDRKSANYKQPSSNHQFLATSDDKKVSSDDLFSSFVDKKSATSELIMVVNAAKSEKLKENLASDNEKSIKDLIKLLVDKKEANAAEEEILNFLTFESDAAINQPKVDNFESLVLNNQDLAISDDEKIFNEVIAALSNGEVNLEEPISDLTAVNNDKVAISDFIIDVNVEKSDSPAIIETNTDIDKTSTKDNYGVKNEGSSVKLITNDDKRAGNHLLKGLVNPKVTNLEEPVLDLENLVPNDDVISMGDFVKIINDLNFIDNNFKKLNSLKYYSDIIKDLGNDLKVGSDQEKGDYDLDKYFFYDIDEPVGYEYYPVVAEKIDDKKKKNSKIVSFFCQHIMFIESYC